MSGSCTVTACCRAGRCCKHCRAQTQPHLSNLQLRACLEQLPLEAAGSITALRHTVLKHMPVMV